jgi:hypothetical protein
VKVLLPLSLPSACGLGRELTYAFGVNNSNPQP